MTNFVRFRVRDDDKKTREDTLVSLLTKRLQMVAATGRIAEELLIVHQNSNELSGDARAEYLLVPDHLYVEYSGASVPWTYYEDEQYWFVKYDDLLIRLQELEPPVTVEALRKALERPPALVDALTNLAILCQGYLVAHAEWDSNTQICGPCEIAAALRSFGWEDVLRGNPGRAAESKVAMRSSLSESSLWKNVLNNDVANQLGMPPSAAVHGLLEVLAAAPRLDAVSLVATVYLEVAEKLMGRIVPKI